MRKSKTEKIISCRTFVAFSGRTWPVLTFDGENELPVAGADHGGRRTAVGSLVRLGHVRNNQRSVVNDRVTRYLAVQLAPLQRRRRVVYT